MYAVYEFRTNENGIMTDILEHGQPQFGTPKYFEHISEPEPESETE